MHNLIGILMGLFVICVLGASHFTRRALRTTLSDSNRTELVRISANLSTQNLLVPIVIGIIYAILVFNNAAWLPTATVIALGLLLAHSVFSAVSTDRAYRAAEMPGDFLRFFRLARGIRILGAAMLFTGIIAWLILGQSQRFAEQREDEREHEIRSTDSPALLAPAQP